MRRNALWPIVALAVTTSTPAQEGDPSTPCIAAYLQSDSVAPLRKKVVLDGNWTLDKLADKSKPSALERKSLASTISAVQACEAQGEQWRARNLPAGLIQIRREHAQGTVLLAADLYAGKLNYGEHNRRDFALAEEMKTKWAAEVVALKQKEDEQRATAQKAAAANESERLRQIAANETARQGQIAVEQAERQRQAAAAEAQERQRQQAIADRNEETRRQIILQSMKNQPPPFQLPMPPPIRPAVTTNCTTYAGQTTCTTR